MNIWKCGKIWIVYGSPRPLPKIFGSCTAVIGRLLCQRWHRATVSQRQERRPSECHYPQQSRYARNRQQASSRRKWRTWAPITRPRVHLTTIGSEECLPGSHAAQGLWRLRWWTDWGSCLSGVGAVISSFIGGTPHWWVSGAIMEGFVILCIAPVRPMHFPLPGTWPHITW